LSSDKISTVMFNLNDPRADAEYFLEHALLNEETASKFSVSVESIDSEEFNVALLDMIEDRFRKQHNPMSQSKFSEDEVKATTCFINQLLLSKIIDSENIKSFMNIITMQPRVTELSEACGDSLTQNLHMAGFYWKFTSLMIPEEEQMDTESV
jgi:hypothetical protein